MTIQLTDEQHRALDADSERPHRIVDPKTQITYLLIPADEYYRDTLDNQQIRNIIKNYGMRGAIDRMNA
ncbi:MAG: hypothetical protein JWM11_1719 [Planctomycetaceae bacterium]|nr:hypothetical protein [Planctomycetaceae bacterium]